MTTEATVLRSELEFHIRMRNCLRGIQHLDPENIAARLVQFDAQIAEFEARIAAEEPSSRAGFEVLAIAAGQRAA